ncbi:MAG: UDP-N-acetylmuramoyl-tripeptide--D-alanyl-D-alanine ligase [Candidatus Shapirobacteria bacterium]
MTIFLKLIIAIIFTHQALFWIYLWQIKEYRFDRFSDSLKNPHDLLKSFKNQYNFLSWFRPKSTFRGLISSLFSLLTIFSLIFYFPLEISIFTTFLIPLISSFFIIIFNPVFTILKKRQINQAKIIMSKFKGITIGVTGSYGKSSTKEILATILSHKFKVEKTPKNNNSEIGVAQTVLNLKTKPEIFVVEMGAYKIGEIKAICNIVKPKIGIITGLGDQHLSLFGSLQNIKTAKYELIKSLPKNGFGLVADKDFSLKDAKNIKTFTDHLEFDYQKHHFSLPLLGKNLIRNVIGAIKIAQYLGMTLSEIQQALDKIDKKLFHPRLITLKNDIFIVDDSYNSSLESFLSALGYLKTWKDYKKVLITPGIIELGSHAEKNHRLIGKNLASIDSIVVTQAHYFKELNQHNNALLISNPKKIISYLKSLKKTKTVFLFKGRLPSIIISSLSHE